MIFDSSRLRIRKFVYTDIDALNAMQQNPAVMKYITGRPKTREETETELEKIIIGYGRPEAGTLIMAVERKADRRFIGACAIIGSEVGFRLDEPYWGQGFGRELFESLVEYCFKHRHMDYIVAEAEEGNSASIRILESRMKFVSSYTDRESGQLVKCYRAVNPDTGII